MVGTRQVIVHALALHHARRSGDAAVTKLLQSRVEGWSFSFVEDAYSKYLDLGVALLKILSRI